MAEVIIRKGVGHGLPTKDSGQACEPRWKALSPEEKLAVVKKLALEGMTEGQINAETGAGNGVVRVICRRHSIKLTKSREIKNAMIVAEDPKVDDDELRMQIARRAARGARETLRQQFGDRRG